MLRLDPRHVFWPGEVIKGKQPYDTFYLLNIAAQRLKKRGGEGTIRALRLST